MYIKVKVFPKAKREGLVQLSEDRFEVHTKAEAKDNKANHATQEILAQFLNVATNKIRLISGHQKPQKTFEVIGS